MITVIRLIEDASLIEDAPDFSHHFHVTNCELCWWETSLIEDAPLLWNILWATFICKCICIKVEFRNNYNATNSWECLSHIFECQITILTGKKSLFLMYFLSLGKRSNWRKYYRYFILCTCSSLVVNSKKKNRRFRRIFQV